MSASFLFVGIEVTRTELVMAFDPSSGLETVPNDESGIRHVLEHLQAVCPALIVLEATGGGYETPTIAALADAGLPVVVANPHQVRDFAKTVGKLAKTDSIDARLLALFAERVRPVMRPIPSEAHRTLNALLVRRRQLIEMLAVERNRLEHALLPVKKSLMQHIHWLERCLADVDSDLDRTVQQSPVWRAKEDLMRKVIGVGPILSRQEDLNFPLLLDLGIPPP
ncbi:MAG: transposase [Candidatus Omnitrophica bacterium]|nr:transposase [Candidatus Omnitrophota bacterium]